MKAHTSRHSVDRACNSVLRRRALRTHELNVAHCFPRGMPRVKGVTHTEFRARLRILFRRDMSDEGLLQQAIRAAARAQQERLRASPDGEEPEYIRGELHRPATGTWTPSVSRDNPSPADRQAVDRASRNRFRSRSPLRPRQHPPGELPHGAHGLTLSPQSIGVSLGRLRASACTSAWAGVVAEGPVDEASLVSEIPDLEVLFKFLKAGRDKAGLPPSLPQAEHQLVRHVFLDVLNSTLVSLAQKQVLLAGLAGLDNFDGRHSRCASCDRLSCPPLVAAILEAVMATAEKDKILVLLAHLFDERDEDGIPLARALTVRAMVHCARPWRPPALSAPELRAARALMQLRGEGLAEAVQRVRRARVRVVRALAFALAITAYALPALAALVLQL